MVKRYCVRHKKQTDSVPGSEHYVKTKNNRLMLKSTCTECGVTKTKFVKEKQGVGIASSMADAGLDLVFHKGIPWLADKSVEMGRYYGSEAL